MDILEYVMLRLSRASWIIDCTQLTESSVTDAFICAS